jgi:hypothetical protein
VASPSPSTYLRFASAREGSGDAVPLPSIPAYAFPPCLCGQSGVPSPGIIPPRSYLLADPRVSRRRLTPAGTTTRSSLTSAPSVTA